MHGTALTADSPLFTRAGILEMCRTALVASTLDAEQGEPPRDQQGDA
jgi:hypothetical protein